MLITLNGGPFDGRVTEVDDGDHPYVYCGYQGDGYVRVYKKQGEKYVYLETVKATEMEKWKEKLN